MYINEYITRRYVMIKPVTRQEKLEFISIEEMVPKDHLLRKIDATIDFEFVKERLYPLYLYTWSA